MSRYRNHVALIRGLGTGTEAFCEPLRGIAEPEITAFLGFIKRHHVGPWLSPVLDDGAANGALPESFLEQLRIICSKSEARTVQLVSQTRELQRGLQDREIDALHFKGIVLGSEAYGDIHRRHQSDVDLMIDRTDLRAVVAMLGEFGYDTDFDSSTGEELNARVHRMIEGPRTTACSLKRKGYKVDLHCSLRTRYDDSIDFRALIDDSKDVEIEDMILRGPSREMTLLIQLIVIAEDLRRSACKAKLFLDLYVICRGLGPDWSWESFFEARRRERLEKLAVNVCALFLDLWDCAAEFPELAAAIDRRARLIEISCAAEADAIIARPRDDPDNKRLIKRIYRGGTARAVARRVAKDLPHAAARFAGLRRSQYRFTSH